MAGRQEDGRELEARGLALRPDDDADLELRAGRCVRLERDLGGDDDSAQLAQRAVLVLEKAMAATAAQ